MPRCRLFLTMTDGTTQQYDVTSYSYAPSGTLLHFTLPDGAVMAILLYWVKSIKVLEIDAPVADTGIAMAAHTGHGTD